MVGEACAKFENVLGGALFISSVRSESIVLSINVDTGSRMGLFSHPLSAIPHLLGADYR